MRRDKKLVGGAVGQPMDVDWSLLEKVKFRPYMGRADSTGLREPEMRQSNIGCYKNRIHSSQSIPSPSNYVFFPNFI